MRTRGSFAGSWVCVDARCLRAGVVVVVGVDLVVLVFVTGGDECERRERREPWAPMMQGGLLTVVYVVIGAFVAAANDYFDHVGDAEGVASAVIAILAWPLILIGIDIRIT